MLINPFEFGVAPGTVLVGFSGAPNVNIGISGNTNTGSAFQAVASGLASTISIRGHSSSGNTANFYLCVYAATSESVWGGALLGKTAAQSPLGLAELRTVSLITPFSIVSGQFYALTVLPDSVMFHAGESGLSTNDRGFSNTYASGPAGTAGALSLNGTNAAAVWLTT